MAKGFRIETLQSEELIKVFAQRKQFNSSPIVKQYWQYCLVKEDIRTIIELNKTIKEIITGKYVFIKEPTAIKPVKRLTAQQIEDAKYNMDVYNTLILQSLFTTIIVTYVKWFTRGNKVKLETAIFRDSPKHLITHEAVVEYRNKYFAHSDDNLHEKVLTIYFPDQRGTGTDFLFGWPLKKRLPTLLEVKKFHALFKHVFNHLCKKIAEIEPKTKTAIKNENNQQL